MSVLPLTSRGCVSVLTVCVKMGPEGDLGNCGIGDAEIDRPCSMVVGSGSAEGMRVSIDMLEVD